MVAGVEAAMAMAAVEAEAAVELAERVAGTAVEES